MAVPPETKPRGDQSWVNRGTTGHDYRYDRADGPAFIHTSLGRNGPYAQWCDGTAVIKRAVHRQERYCSE